MNNIQFMLKFMRKYEQPEIDENVPDKSLLINVKNGVPNENNSAKTSSTQLEIKINQTITDYDQKNNKFDTNLNNLNEFNNNQANNDIEQNFMLFII